MKWLILLTNIGQRCKSKEMLSEVTRHLSSYKEILRNIHRLISVIPIFLYKQRNNLASVNFVNIFIYISKINPVSCRVAVKIIKNKIFQDIHGTLNTLKISYIGNFCCLFSSESVCSDLSRLDIFIIFIVADSEGYLVCICL